MAQVSFYVVDGPLSVETLACRLCRRVAIGANTPLFVRFGTADAMTAFDQLLWSFEADSFVPHHLDDGSIQASAAPVRLGLQLPDDFAGCCLNLADDAVNAHALAHVLEIIGPDEHARLTGRVRFRAYQQQGIAPKTHKISA